MANQQFQPLFIIAVFTFIMLQSMVGDVGDENRRELERQTLDSIQNATDTAFQELATHDWEHGYGNVTGFTLSYRDYMDGLNVSNHQEWKNTEKYSIIPDKVRDRVETVLGDEATSQESSYLLNLSGRAHGKFLSEKSSGIDFKIPEYIQSYVDDDARQKYEDQKQRYEDDPMTNEPPQWPILADRMGNFTGQDGSLGLRFAMAHQKNSSEISDLSPLQVNVGIDIASSDEGERHEIQTKGVYFPERGVVVTTTHTAKFFGPYGLPHLVPQSLFSQTRDLMGKLLNGTILNTDDLNELASNATESCEAIAYFKLKRTKYSKEELQMIDKELHDPTGSPIPGYYDLPKVEVEDFLVYSPDCAKIFSQLPTEPAVSGLLDPVLKMDVKRALVFVLVCSFAQLWLLLRQKRTLRTPGDLSAVSKHTLSMIALQDSTVDIALLLISPNVGKAMGRDLFLLCASIIMVLSMKCMVFETALIMSIVNSQWSERESTWWGLLRGQSRNTRPETNQANQANETNQTNQTDAPQTDATPNRQPVSIDDDSWFFFIFGVGFFMSLALTFIFLSTITMRKPYRYATEYAGLIAVNTIWVPQFFRNTLKNRRIFSWEYVIGTSAVRVAPIFYVCLCSRNPLRHRFEPFLALTVAFWLSLQIGLLYLQARLGARFWLNEKWLPKTYDYHPVISMGDLESGFGSLGSEIQSSSEEDDVRHCKITCSICMVEIDVPVVKGENRKVDTKAYMVTPCRHVFHSECLESWMRYKLQCPVCREELPPN